MAPGSIPCARPQPGQAWRGWVKMGGKWPKLEAPALGGLWEASRPHREVGTGAACRGDVWCGWWMPCGPRVFAAPQGSDPSALSSKKSSSVCPHHRDTSVCHGDTSMCHGDTSVHCGDTTMSHGDTSTHCGDTSVCYGDASMCHGDTSVLWGHLNMSWGHLSVPWGCHFTPGERFNTPWGSHNPSQGHHNVSRGHYNAP